MGKSPAQSAADKFRGDAKKAVDKAKAQQAKLTAEIQAQIAAYKGNAPADIGAVQKAISTSTGSNLKNYIKNTKAEFAQQTQAITDKYRKDLENFEPGIMGSQSQLKLDAYLTALRDKYGADIEKLGKAGRERLNTLPEEAFDAFTVSSQSPAFNNLLNEQYMSLAKNPPTISNDAMNMYRDIWTYNV